MDEHRIDLLSRKIADGSATDAEVEEYNNWFSTYDSIDYAMKSEVTQTELKRRIYTNVANSLNFNIAKPKEIKLWPRIAAAASIILCLGIGGYFYLHNKPAEQLANNIPVKNDIAPGGNKAILTLSNGKKISLTDAANGGIAQQAGVTITKTADGKIIYATEQGDQNPSANEFNTIETPKGGQYQIRLPDGTDVWLNAASTLKYPASFASRKERRVELTGEGFFQVSKDKKHPFIVETSNQKVEVLGTHFNINSYADESESKTALLEGSVKINNQTIIKPGEQASSSKIEGSIQVTSVDVEKIIAWKNGRFIFENEAIESIMRKLSRWYNVEVIYQDDVRDLPFTAFISRRDNISKILDKITYTQNIHFKIEGRRIYIMK